MGTSVCSLFSPVVLPATDKPVLKVPSKLKECVRTAREEVEKRLREEQKLVNSFLFRMVACYMAGTVNGCVWGEGGGEQSMKLCFGGREVLGQC